MHPNRQSRLVGKFLVRRTTWLVILFLAARVGPVIAAEDYIWDDVSRIVAIGDLHGDYPAFVAIMRSAELIDDDGDWVGGTSHLVQTGDIPDRGPDTNKIIDHLRDLRKQAKKAGGRVHTLIGNHEAMSMVGDFRYVHPDDYKLFVTRKSSQERDLFFDFYVSQFKTKVPKEEWPEFDNAYRETWNKEIPLGYTERRAAWRRKGKYGRWVLKNPTIVMINKVLFVHGGLSPKFMEFGLAEINKRVRRELATSSMAAEHMVHDDDGPLWYRGLALNDEIDEESNLVANLARYGASRIVIAHSTTYGPVDTRFGGRVILIDTGISKAYGGHQAYLIIEGEKLVAVHNGAALPLEGGSTQERLQYLRQVRELLTDTRRLDQRIAKIEASINP